MNPIRRVIAFMIGSERFCLDVRFVKSVVKVGPITRVPYTPRSIAGVMNNKGEIISLLELAHLGIGTPGHYDRVIVVEVRGEILGVLVTSVGESFVIPEAPAVDAHGSVALQEGEAIMIDLEQLVQADELEQLRKGTRV